jgi:hypothetical protein
MAARSLTNALGAASLALGAAGIVAPRLLARATGTSTLEARELGFRDVAIGVAIYASPRIGLAQRAFADFGDAVAFARRKPWISTVALCGAAVAAYALARET